MKRGTSGLSLIVGVDKPAGMSSHDVVNACRRIFGERRVGHTGTLDPLATGVLPICVGPATRLDAYLVGHEKRYLVRVAFGAATTTDDAEGEVLRSGSAPASIYDVSFAAQFVAGLVGTRKQLPPAYCAIKVDGKRAYAAARQGVVIDLAPRDIEVYAARLVGVSPGDEAEAYPWWDVEFHVSKGTYIRALARDIGAALGCPAHVAALRRTQAGLLSLDECLTLEALGQVKEKAALDPVRLLGLRFIFADGPLAAAVQHGAAIQGAEVTLFEQRRASWDAEFCACTAGARESCTGACDGETVAVVADRRLAALYEYVGERGVFKARCVFQTGVSRGGDI